MPVSSRKLAEWFYGGHQPRDVALAISLGILTGALTGGNASWAIVLLAAIALNAHTRLFLCAWSLSALIAWLASGAVQTAGQCLLNGTSLGRALIEPGDDLLIPLLGWNQEGVIGGMALGGVVALVGGIISYRLTVKLNRCWYATPPRPPAGEAVEPVGPLHPVAPVLTCLWYGPSQAERTYRRQAASRRLRRCGVPSTLAASLVLTAACWSLAHRQAERELWRQLRACSAGTATAGSTDISLWTGRFTLRDLHVARPEAPGHDRLYVQTAKGSLSVGRLLRGYVSVDKLVLEDVRIGNARATTRRRSDFAGESADALGDNTHEKQLVLNYYLRHWDLFCRQLGVLEQVVAAVSHLPALEHCAERTASSFSDAAIASPRFEIRQVRIADLENGLNLGQRALLEAKNLSSRPELAGHPAELKLILPKFGAEIEIKFDADVAAKHRVRCSFCNLDLPQIVDSPYVSRAVCVHAGRARLTGEGMCDTEGFKLRFAADIESLAADVSSQEPLAGIEPDTWQQGLARLGSFRAQLELAGPWSSPALSVDRRNLVTGFQRQLQLAGATDLLGTVSLQLASHRIQREGPFVIQTSALAAQSTADPAGFCDFSEDALPQAADEPAPEATAVVERLPALTEEVAEDDPATEIEPATNLPPPEAALPPPPVRRPSPRLAAQLPGPVNMAIGHDPNGAVFSSGSGARAAADGPHQKALSRVSRAWRETFPRPPDGAPTADEPPAAPAAAPPVPPREPISAAASEAWYNRRWR